MNNKRKIIILGVFLLVAFSSCAAQAMKCKSPTLEKAYSEADIVLAAMVSNVSSESPYGAKETSSDRLAAKRDIKLNVIKVWKGKSDPSLTISSIYDTDYPVEIEKDKNYIFFFKDKTEDNAKYVLRKCDPLEEIGLQNGYLVAVILDQIHQAKTYPQINEIIRTPKNTFIGYGMGLTEEENIKLESRDPYIDILEKVKRDAKGSK